MELLNKIRKSFLKWDMFAAPATLRAKGQPDYQTVVGAFLSLSLLIFFGVVFYLNVVSVATKTYIQSTSQTGEDLEDASQMTGLMFAIGIKDVNLSKSTNKYFDVRLTTNLYIDYSPRPIPTAIPLIQCQQSDWNNLGDNFKNAYNMFKMDVMLCPNSSYDVSVRGLQSLSKYQSLELRVERCANSSNCASSTDIDSYFSSQITTGDYVQVRVFFVDTLIRGEDSIPATRTLKRNIIMAFTPKSGVRGKIYLSKYQIQTDESIFPYSQVQTTTGNYVSGAMINNVEISSTRYLILMIQKSTQQLVVSRNHGKIDNVLSYIGGLFGLVFGLLMLCMKSYNEYNYQLYVGQSVFDSDPQAKEKSFGFLSYIQFQIYDLLSSFCDIKWLRMNNIQKAKDQATQQMDIRLLLKKVNYLQNISSILLQQHQRMAIYLIKPPSIEEVAKMRKCFEESQKMMQIESVKGVEKQIQIEQKQQKKQKQQQNYQNIQSSGAMFKLFPFNFENVIPQHTNNNNQVSPQNQQSGNDRQIDFITAMTKQVMKNALGDKIDKKIADKISLSMKEKILLKKI